MKTIVKTIIKIILVLWQLPQIILGSLLLGVVLLFEKYDEAQKNNDVFIIKTQLFVGGLSLGYFVFIPSFDESLVKHELGHCKQSLYLGWLYLLLIGVPSFVWASLSRVSKSVRVNYYKLYCEAWADRLGGVDR